MIKNFNKIMYRKSLLSYINKQIDAAIAVVKEKAKNKCRLVGIQAFDTIIISAVLYQKWSTVPLYCNKQTEK